MRNKRSIDLVCFEVQIHEARAVQTSVEAGRVGGFLLRALMVALVLFSAGLGETAELKKFALGFSTGSTRTSLNCRRNLESLQLVSGGGYVRYAASNR